MLTANIESIGFDFRIVIFPKDYEKYEKIIQDYVESIKKSVEADVSVFSSDSKTPKRPLEDDDISGQ